MDRSDLSRGVRVVAGVAWLAAAVLVLANPTRFVLDDAYFYLEIAKHVVQGQGSTFHGLGPTNGYHPLWLAVCVPLLGLSGATGVSALRLVVGVQLAMTVAGGFLFTRLLRRVALPLPIVALAYVGTFVMTGGLWVSEGIANALLQVAAVSLLLAAHAQRERPLRWLSAGLVLGLAVLARLDLVFLAGAFGGSALVQPGVPARARLRDFALLAGAAGCVVAPYLLANLVTTGHVVPVSGALKSSFPVPDTTGFSAKLGPIGRSTTFGAALCALLAFRVRGPARRLMVVLALAALAEAAYVVFFTAPGWATDSDYYWVGGALCYGLAASVACAWLARLKRFRSPRRTALLGRSLAAALVAIGLLGAARRTIVHGPDGFGWRPEPVAVRLGRWLDERVEPDARIFTVDSPGRLAWFSHRPVLAADGLTHDRGYAKALQQPDLAAWLRRMRVGYVVAQISDQRAPWVRVWRRGERAVAVDVLVPGTDRLAGRLDLSGSRLLVRSTQLPFASPGDEPVGVWRWPES